MDTLYGAMFNSWYLSKCRRKNKSVNLSDFEIAFNLGVNYSEHWIEFSDEKPEYYTPVILDTSKWTVIAWRAWSEQFGDIYTINGTDIVLSEKPKRWKPISYSEYKTIE